jgi:hypothetical protein
MRLRWLFIASLLVVVAGGAIYRYSPRFSPKIWQAPAWKDFSRLTPTPQSGFCNPHPELREGEVFFDNASDLPLPPIIGIRPTTTYWQMITWRTKRRGKVAYDDSCHVLEGKFPVFVRRKELSDGGINPDTLRPFRKHHLRNS